MRASSLLATFALALILILGSISKIQSSDINERSMGTPAGWTDDIRLTDNAISDRKVQISVDGSEVHLTWRRIIGNMEVFHIYSNDSGKSWANPTQISSSGIGADNPDVAVNNSITHIVWQDWKTPAVEIFYRNSTDGGKNWNPEKRISTNDGFSSIGPKIFTNNSNIHTSWMDLRDGNDGEIYYRRSLDGGLTFENGQGIDTDRRVTFSPDAITAPTMAGYESNISVVWSDMRDGDWEIYWMISKDNGFTWEDGLGTPNVGRKMSDDTTDSGPGAVATNGSDIHIVWVDEEWPGPVYRLYYRNSTDNGATWTPIQLLTGPNLYSDMPDISVNSEEIHIVWFDRRDDGTTHEVYYKNSTDGGISWSGDIRLTYNESYDSIWPKIGLNNQMVHVAWVDDRDAQPEIYYKRSPDFDTTPPSHTNETPPPDSYRDAPGTNISVHVTDSSGVNDTTIQLYVNGSLVTHTSTPITDGFNVSFISPGFDPGVVTCRIVADDNCSNTLDFTWNFTVLATYEIQLHEGWNLISVPHVQVDTSLDEVLRDINGKWNYIQWYDASDSNDHWKTNATFKPQQLNDLFYLNRSMAFWINITEPNVNLTVRGLYPGSTIIPLYRGWNLVGYPSLNTETVGNALFGTTADRVEVCDISEPYNIREVGPEYVMKPGEGYWIHVVADSTWVVDW